MEPFELVDIELPEEAAGTTLRSKSRPRPCPLLQAAPPPCDDRAPPARASRASFCRAGTAIDLLNHRKGMLLDMSGANAAGMVTVQYEVPSRGMNGVKTKLLSATKGRAARRNGPLRPLEGTAPCARLVAPRARAALTPPGAR